MTDLLGLNLEAKELTLLQICLRAIIVFFVTLVIVRVADRRFLSKLSAFDVIVGFLLASMMARAVNGSAAFLPTLVGGFVLVLLHRALALISFYSDAFGRLIKGEASVLIENGEAKVERLRAWHLTEKDLLEELHLNGNVERVKQVQKATFERNGKISVIPAKD